MSHDSNDPLAPFRREPQPVASELEQEPLSERDALRLAIKALSKIPDHEPLLRYKLREAYENATANEKLNGGVSKLLEENEQLKTRNAELLEALRMAEEQMTWYDPLIQQSTRENDPLFYREWEEALNKARDATIKAQPVRQAPTREASTPELERDKGDLEPEI